jgi:hypothetical protein
MLFSKSKVDNPGVREIEASCEVKLGRKNVPGKVQRERGIECVDMFE